jgi:hypothetical protein
MTAVVTLGECLIALVSTAPGPLAEAAAPGDQTGLPDRAELAAILHAATDARALDKHR